MSPRGPHGRVSGFLPIALMDYGKLLSAAGLYITTFAVCLVSAVVPVVNAEAYLLAVSALIPPSAVVPVVMLSAVGQMIGKTGLYLAGRGLFRLPARYDAKIGELRAKLEQRKGRTDVLLFVSAFSGFPPFYALSILAGALRFSFGEFLVWGLVGRILRFAVVVLFPQAVKELMA